MLKSFVCALCVTLTAATVLAQDQRPVDVLFLELKAIAGFAPEKAQLIENVILSELAKYKRFHVISKSDVRNMLDAEKLKEAMDCDQASCMAEIAGALGTELIVAGDLGSLGENDALLSLQLVSNLEGRVLARVSTNLSGTGPVLIPQVQRGVMELISGYDPSYDLNASLARVNQALKEHEGTVLTSWWLWTGVALVAGGVATALVLSQGGEAAMGAIQDSVEVGP